MTSRPTPTVMVAALAVLALIAAPACAVLPFTRTVADRGNTIAGGNRQLVAQTRFVASVPEPLQDGETLTLSVMDEVTGLLVNAVNYTMSRRDDLTYDAVLPLPLNAAIKYRYVRTSTTVANEDTTVGTPVRYRLYVVHGPGEVQDTIADWSDKAFTRPTGAVQGRVLNADTGSPVPNLLVTAGGAQSITDSSGRFAFLGLPTTTHNLVIYAMDGTYQPFQQGATVAEGQTTSVDVRLKPAEQVNVTFHVTAPDDSVAGVPIRMAGNILQLGNTFADLQGGLSTIADRMPVLSLTADGRYELTMSLPSGAHIEYKYTLGDGFWNAEHHANGAFVIRELTVPNQDLEVNDTIHTWRAGDGSPILFEATVPQLTPPGDIVYIQFNPYGWTEPIPMWPLGNNVWTYKLYGPLSTVGEFGYRYCRNAQCGVADDAATAGGASSGHRTSSTLLPQEIKDVVGAWAWFENPEPTTLVGAAITSRGEDFVTGIEFSASYLPSWSYYGPQALANAQALGANHVILAPTWTYSQLSPITLGPEPGKDALWIDSAQLVSQARALGLSVGLFPNPVYRPSSGAGALDPVTEFWTVAPRDSAWWTRWFEQYADFAVHHADLASLSGAQILILGGEIVSPALPGGVLPDGSVSGAPDDAADRWTALLLRVRQHFSGKILWALPFEPEGFDTPLPFLQDADGIYLLWDAPLTSQAGASKDDLVAAAGRLLDNGVSALPSVIDEPLYLAIAYPSAGGAASGCTADGSGQCIPWSALGPPNASANGVTVDLQAQADLYEAMLTAVNARPWISGVVSRGYYPPAALQDPSASVHGKPAADILWYWLPRLSGLVR